MTRLFLSEDSVTSIALKQGVVESQALVDVANRVNTRLRQARAELADTVDLFDVIDLRMLSGLVGELFTSELAATDPRLLKNPNLDGYPDLCDMSRIRTASKDPADYLNHADGGIEVKNTFGLKKQGISLAPRETRAERIQPTLVWKAHHQYTNNLLALQSDYLEGVPQIVRGFFADNLVEDDWTLKQNPSAGSTMTSFCQTKKSAFEKLREGEVFRMKSYAHV